MCVPRAECVRAWQVCLCGWCVWACLGERYPLLLRRLGPLLLGRHLRRLHAITQETRPLASCGKSNVETARVCVPRAECVHACARLRRCQLPRQLLRHLSLAEHVEDNDARPDPRVVRVVEVVGGEAGHGQLFAADFRLPLQDEPGDGYLEGA